MPNTYTQIHIQFVFAVKYRQSLIVDPYRERIEKYMTGIVQNFEHKLLSIYCMPDHAHLFVGFNPRQAISDFVKEVKSKTTDFIKDKKLAKGKFNWQEGYGAFSYSKSHVQSVNNYILNQPKHHQKRSFRKEYIQLLQKFEVQYDDRYLFNWILE